VPEPAIEGKPGRVFLPVMLVLFGLGTAVVLTAQLIVLVDDLDHGAETSPWFVLALLASAVQLIGVLAVAFRRRWGAKILAGAFLAGAVLDLGQVTGASALLIIAKILVGGLLAAAVLVRWDDLVA
jgi:hypothetical protein